MGGFRSLKGRGQSSNGGVFVKKIVITSGGASLIKDYDLHGYRRGGTFDSPKVPKSDLGLRPKNPTHRNARPERLRRPGAWAKRCL